MLFIILLFVMFVVLSIFTSKSDNLEKCTKCGLPLVLVKDGYSHKVRCSRCGAFH
jgi:hypothetical protein